MICDANNDGYNSLKIDFCCLDLALVKDQSMHPNLGKSSDEWNIGDDEYGRHRVLDKLKYVVE